MYGNEDKVQNENTKFKPRSPYGTAKLYSYWINKIIEKHMVFLFKWYFI